ncbi:MAG: bile acid:sodium symporter [Acidimicrobiia bacterium]|nr:bile acid:sodium symporter [Acidimicrobiia bacterium]
MGREPVDAVLAVMNAVFLAFVVSTMFNVGLQTTWEQLSAVLANLRWLLGAVLASLVAVPLIGWGLAEAFPLEGATFVALVIVASSPGAPFAVSLTGIAKGDLISGAATMAILAVIGSVTAPLTVGLILGGNDVAAAGGGSIDVGELVLSIVLLQIVPFITGMAIRAWAPAIADAWAPPAKKVSSVTFGLVMLAIVVGGMQQVIDLIGSWIIIAGFVAGITWFAAGALLAPSPQRTRATGGILAANRNAGPVLVIATASFAEVEGVIPAIITVLIVQLVTQVVLASWLGRRKEEVEATA